jgi:hypothetical protein
MVSFGFRIRKRAGDPPSPDDQRDLEQRVLTGLLRMTGVDIDPRTGRDRQTDWLRMRAEAMRERAHSAEPAQPATLPSPYAELRHRARFHGETPAEIDPAKG